MFPAGRLVAALLVGLAAAGCEPGGELDLATDARQRMRYRHPKDRGNWLSPARAAELIRTTSELQVLCVAALEDYRRGHLAGSMLIPVTGLRRAVARGAKNTLYPAINRGRTPTKDKPLLVYCWWNDCKCPSVPTYSGLARRILREQGFEKVYSIEGGMRAWQAAKMPCEKGQPLPTAPAKGAVSGDSSTQMPRGTQRE